MLRIGNPLTCNLANSEDPDDNTAFHQGLLLFGNTKSIFRERNINIFENYNL